MQGKRLFRSRTERIVAGVAGGLAAYLNIDPLLVRLAFLILSFVNGIGLFLYVALWVLTPNEDSVAQDTRAKVRENVSEMQEAAESVAQRVRGMFNN